MDLEKLLDSEFDMDTLAAEVCKGSFFEFIKEFWHVVVNETPVWNWHIEYLADVLQNIAFKVQRREPRDYDYVIINVPPGSSKSTICSILYPMWCWAVDPTQRFICSSYAGDISLDLAEKCRKVFTSDKYQKYFPHVGVDTDNEAKSNFKNKVGGQRYSTSTGANITGVHAHQIIVDDPMNPTQSSSEVARKTANKYLDETLSTRMVDKDATVTILIMQRLHEEDCTGHVLKKIESGMRVMHICLPAEVSDNIKPSHLVRHYTDGLFDPVRLGRVAIKNLRTVLGSYGASGQLDQRPSPADGGILKKKWFEIVDRPIPSGAAVHFRLDTAYTDKQRNDPSGFFAYFMEYGIMYIVNAENHYLEFPKLTKYIPTYVQNHGYTPRSKIKVEPKASGKSVVQALQRSGINIMEDRPPTDDKVTKANAIAPTCEALRVKLLRGGWNEEFLNQVAAFPNAAHDDMVDCLVNAVIEEMVQERNSRGYRRKN